MRILFSKKAKKQLENLNSRFQQKIIFMLDKFQSNQPVDIIKLKNREQEFRISAGNYRIQLQKANSDFLVTKIGKRENFYNLLLI